MDKKDARTIVYLLAASQCNLPVEQVQVSTIVGPDFARYCCIEIGIVFELDLTSEVTVGDFLGQIDRSSFLR